MNATMTMRRETDVLPRTVVPASAAAAGDSCRHSGTSHGKALRCGCPQEPLEAVHSFSSRGLVGYKQHMPFPRRGGKTKVEAKELEPASRNETMTAAEIEHDDLNDVAFSRISMTHSTSRHSRQLVRARLIATLQRSSSRPLKNC